MINQITKSTGTAGQVLSCVGDSRLVTLTKQLATSGEGQVWHTDWPGHIAKLYYHPTYDRIHKLEVMIAHPPTNPNEEISHISFAWPKALLKDTAGNSVGFVMPEIANSIGLFDVYNPQRRRKVLPAFNWLYLHVTAMNIASITQAIHAKGYVLGDIKPQNILVTNQALPSIIDTDSFQVKDPATGQVFRCLVGSEGFTPPELLERDLAQLDQTEENDRFRLGVIIHLLLFGDQPFKGLWTGAGDSPDPNQLLRLGHWPYGVSPLIQPSPLTIPLDTVHPELQQCFLRCFNDGHWQPNLRPTPPEWLKALKVAIADLKACRHVNCHYYSQHYGHCYWCDRKKELGIDVFSKATLSREQRRARHQDNVETLVKPWKQTINTANTYLDVRRVVPSLSRLKALSLRLLNLGIKYTILAGVLSIIIGAVFFLGKIFVVQEDIDATLFNLFLLIGLFVFWSYLTQSSD
ncbi:MAG: hypothetical protein AAGC93_09905 [Cyanobacteria bacterium P01_F01_bin.53]